MIERAHCSAFNNMNRITEIRQLSLDKRREQGPLLIHEDVSL